MFQRRGTFAALCETDVQAEAEIRRLLDGIDGFGTESSIMEVERIEDGWSAMVDVPEDEYEYASFTIFDDGDMDWT